MKETNSIIRPIPNFKGYYASDKGVIFSRWERGYKIASKRILGNSLKELRQATDKQGYKRLTLVSKSKKTLKSVHRLVLETFKGKDPVKKICCHNDGNPSNNNITNLRWGTPKDNALDMKKHGRVSGLRGEKHKLCKLSDQDI